MRDNLKVKVKNNYLRLKLISIFIILLLIIIISTSSGILIVNKFPLHKTWYFLITLIYQETHKDRSNVIIKKIKHRYQVF